MQTASASVFDFHGGITDNYIDNSPEKYKEADNFFITVNRKLHTRPGSELYDSDYPKLPNSPVTPTLDPHRVNHITSLEGDLLFCSQGRIWNKTTTFNELLGPASGYPFVGVDESKNSFGVWNKHLFGCNDNFSKPIKIYKDGSSVYQVRTAGLPAFPTSPAINLSGTPGVNVITYAFHYEYQYYVGTTLFIDNGPIVYKQYDSADAPNINNITITNLPVLANGAGDNYDTANIKKSIYRTTLNGDTYFFVASVSNATTSYVDAISDATIQDQSTLYVTGGLAESGTPPLCKYFHVVNNCGWYANIKDGTQLFPYRFYQSLQNDIDGVPASFYGDLEDEIVGVSSFGTRPIYLCKRFIYTIDGIIFDDLSGGHTINRISDVAGCVSNNSVVQIPTGIVWAGQDGFYYSDGYQVVKISKEFSETYADLVLTETQKKRIYGTYDGENKRVFWAVQTSESANNDVDKIFVLDLKFGIKEDMPFTTWSGGDDFSPTALYVYSGRLGRGHRLGYIFYHDNAFLNDPLVDDTKLVSEWDTQAIIYNYVSCASSFGSSTFRKWVPHFYIQASNKSNASIQIISNNDLNAQRIAVTPIYYKGNPEWGNPVMVWGDDNIKWNSSGLIEERRYFGSSSLRCSYKQIEITNAEIILYKSDDYCTAVVDAGLQTATLSDTAGFDWPEGLIGQYLQFDFDNYETKFLITARTADVLTLANPGSALVSGTHKWIINGVPKSEVINLIGYSVDYALLGQTQKRFSTSDTGGNA